MALETGGGGGNLFIALSEHTVGRLCFEELVSVFTQDTVDLGCGYNISLVNIYFLYLCYSESFFCFKFGIVEAVDTRSSEADISLPLQARSILRPSLTTL